MKPWDFPSFWWDKYLDIEHANLSEPSSRNYRFYLLHREINTIVGRGNSMDELNELAEAYLNRLFEQFFLINN